MSSSSLAEAKPLTLVAPAPARRRRPRTSSAPHKQGARPRPVLLLVGSLATLVGAAPGFYALERHSTLRAELVGFNERMETRVQQLDAGIRFDSRRQRLLLGVRDEILTANASLGPTRAYEYATHLVTACEKYPTVDPLLLLAIGTAESRFDASATSPARARGLYQILPSTGRMLAGMLGWQFGEDLLHDPAKNTALAALYLHVLFTAYNDESLVLAEYNGGPLNAGYMRAGGGKASAETRNYVAKVLELRKRLDKRFELAGRNETATNLTIPQTR